MEKQEFEELVKLLKENNKYSENISSRLDKIDNTLEKIKNDAKKKHKSMFDL